MRFKRKKSKMADGSKSRDTSHIFDIIKKIRIDKNMGNVPMEIVWPV
jgi:hypothetical protein